MSLLSNNHKDDELDARAKLLALLDNMRIAMLVSHSSPQTLRARPMYMLSTTHVEDLVFMTDASSMKLIEIRRNPQVLLAFSNESSNRYVTVTGTATQSHDPVLAKSLWNLQTEAWWPEGPDDPNLALLRVRPESVEYWDGPSKLSYSLSLVSSLVSGKRMEQVGDHGELDLKS